MSDITTEAGNRLREWFMQEERAAWLLPHIDGHIAAIEAEARAAERARLRERVEGLGATVVTNAKWDARGVLTIEHDSLGTGTQMLDRAAVLAILEEETK